MKRLILVLCFQSSFCFGLEWPQGLFQANTLELQFFNTFKNYMTQVIENHALFPGPNSLRIIEDEQSVLNIFWKKTASGLTVAYEGRWNRITMLVEVEGDLDPFKLAIFNFDQLLKKSDYRISFPEIQFNFRKETNNNKILLSYDPEWGSIFFYQIVSPKRLESRLWYRCDDCTGEPLLYQHISGGVPQYFAGPLTESVTPQRYFELGGRYLGGINRQAPSIIDRLKFQFGFPKTRD